MGSKYTIVRGTIFQGEHVDPGQIIEADEANEAEIKQLVRYGKIVEGAKKLGAATSNKVAAVTDKKSEGSGEGQ